MATNSTNTPADDPLQPADEQPESAADIIREKLDRIYADEPNAAEELTEAEAPGKHSKHQKFIHKLSTSGKDLASIQTEWHEYYQKLPAHEKHQVWQEFYSSQPALAMPAPPSRESSREIAQAKQQAIVSQRAKERAAKASRLRDARSKEEVQAAIRDKVSAGGKLQAKHHLQSLLFGLGVGAVVLFIFLFGFFNEVFIAPFIQPSRAVASTPLIINNSGVAPSSTPEVIIPKINVQIPVDYNQSTIDEATLQNALENGVVHYPGTAKPGEQGNAAFFGHSSNNIFNKGKYKFAFVMLRTLVEGDTFYLSYGGKVYVYKVFSKQVVDPSNVSVLKAVAGQTATATLITCDPPGTTFKRMVIVGQQISPDPSGNAQATTAIATDTTAPEALPGQGPTLLSRIVGTPLGKVAIAGLFIGLSFIAIRFFNRWWRSPV